MRRAISIAGLLSLFLFTLSSLMASPIVHGYFIEKLPDKLGVKLPSKGKSLVLAQILNANHATLKSGSYEVGVEIKTNGKRRKYALKPSKTIQRDSLATFRMAIPVSEIDKSSGSFRVFTKTGDETIWSSPSSFLQGIRKSKNGITTLYTEAPPERILPPPEVPFEHGSKMSVTKKSSDKVAKLTPKPQKKQMNGYNKSPESQKVVARNINSSEFKKLRTIDEELVIYIIKKGDTLKSIAQKYYGNSKKEKIIANLNFIENPETIKVGEEIIIDVKPLEEVANNNTATKKLDSSYGKTYTIHSGDTLSKIAKKLLGTSRKVNKILKANPGIEADKLKVGMKINIPECKGGDA